MVSGKLTISELFYSIQGEGPNAGKTSVFIRFPQCNLACGIGKYAEHATWSCDSWNIMSTSIEYSFPEIKDILVDLGVWEDILKGNVMITFTGGEPLLYLKEMSNFLQFLAEEGRVDTTFNTFNKSIQYEIETNGSIDLKGLPFFLTEHVDVNYLLKGANSINCSLKLSNSGLPVSKRSFKMIDLAKLTYYPNICFKFVVASEGDIQEIYDLDLPEDVVIYLMPAGDTMDKLHKTSKLAWETATKNRWRYSDRLHIRIYNDLPGV